MTQAPAKTNLHPRNLHRDRYDFAQLIKASPELASYVAVNAYGNESIDFADPQAVKALNRALLKQYYGIATWDIPDLYLCPPIPGRADYLHYLADALLVREFRRYPLARSTTARVPTKVTLTDLGVRNAIFRGAPSLWESAPDGVGPLIETLVQQVLRGPGMQAHFYRDYSVKGDRRSPIEEVDFVVEALDGQVVPVEVKFRRKIDPEDERALRRFVERFKAPLGLLVTRDLYRHEPGDPVLCVPLLDFLLAF